MPNYPIPMTPGYYMPTSYMPYANSVPQQSFAPAPAPMPNNQGGGVIWVDGEQAARSFQLPAGWPANTPFALWDSNAKVVYWKSINQFGAPNQLIKIPYQWDDNSQTQQAVPVSGTVSETPAMDSYATKNEIGKLTDEITSLKDMLINKFGNQSVSGNQNGGNRNSQSGQNRGGNA